MSYSKSASVSSDITRLVLNVLRMISRELTAIIRRLIFSIIFVMDELLLSALLHINKERVRSTAVVTSTEKRTNEQG